MLEPDHVARLLTEATTGPQASDVRIRGPLTVSEVAGIAPLLAGAHPHRACRVLTAGLATDADRERFRFVVGERRPDGPTVANGDRWEDLALLVALDGDGPDVVGSDR